MTSPLSLSSKQICSVGGSNAGLTVRGNGARPERMGCLYGVRRSPDTGVSKRHVASLLVAYSSIRKRVRLGSAHGLSLSRTARVVRYVRALRAIFRGAVGAFGRARRRGVSAIASPNGVSWDVSASSGGLCSRCRRLPGGLSHVGGLISGTLNGSSTCRGSFGSGYRPAVQVFTSVNSGGDARVRRPSAVVTRLCACKGPSRASTPKAAVVTCTRSMAIMDALRSAPSVDDRSVAAAHERPGNEVSTSRRH